MLSINFFLACTLRFNQHSYQTAHFHGSSSYSSLLTLFSNFFFVFFCCNSSFSFPENMDLIILSMPTLLPKLHGFNAYIKSSKVLTITINSAYFQVLGYLLIRTHFVFLCLTHTSKTSLPRRILWNKPLGFSHNVSSIWNDLPCLG